MRKEVRVAAHLLPGWDDRDQDSRGGPDAPPPPACGARRLDDVFAGFADGAVPPIVPGAIVVPGAGVDVGFGGRGGLPAMMSLI